MPEKPNGIFLEEKIAFVVFVLMAVFFICCLVSSVIMCARGGNDTKVSLIELEARRRMEEDEEMAVVSAPYGVMVANNH